MAYVGNTPADKTLKLEKQQFTTSATTSYTLDHSVSDPQDIALFINNVRQNPNSSYTVSGTALTLSAATASTDTMYCVFLGRAIGTVGIGAGSVTKDKVDFISDSSGSGVISKGDGSSIDGSIQLNCHVNSHGIKLKSPPHSAGATYTLTFPNSISADKFLKTDGSGNLSFASAGNSPAFAVRKTDGDQSYSQNTWTKVTFNTELLDTDNAFASDKFTVPSGEAGTYLFNVSIQMGSIATGSAYHIKLYKNGSDYTSLVQHATSDAEYPLYGGVQSVDLAVGDYIEVYGLTNGGAGNFINNKCQFTGFKLGA